MKTEVIHKITYAVPKFPYLYYDDFNNTVSLKKKKKFGKSSNHTASPY